MKYLSTRDGVKTVSSSTCILKGIAQDGGLFVPESFPQFTASEIAAFADRSYAERALEVLSCFLTDFTEQELISCIDNAYCSGSFDTRECAPIRKLDGTETVLELWHGPTFAFKDMALQLLPHLIVTAKAKENITDEIMILVATSGDTGKAALEGFADVAGTRIAVFFPEQGVSHMQKLQMVTQRGDNVIVGAIRGNFDDAQTAVKKIFTDEQFNDRLARQGVRLSSANSINWGRLVPQIVYYFSAYADMCKNGTILAGDKINVVVPTGNFGDILAGYYAFRMGLPVNRFICASNSNNVLTDFINTGVYNAKRDFYKTVSPSMDILISSNLERLLYHLSDDAQLVASLMASLKATGSFTIDKALLARLQQMFTGGYATEEQTAQTIKQTYELYDYIIDTHTAVAQSVYKQYAAKTGDKTPTLVVSTASPFKFAANVYKAITGTALSDAEAAEKLEQMGADEPEMLRTLEQRPVLHELVCNPGELEGIILAGLMKD